MKNLYSVLDIRNDATLSDIKKAYRLKAKLYHPDSNNSMQDSSAKFIEIKEAYDILKNQNLRNKYDLELLKYTEELNLKNNSNKDNINDINRNTNNNSRKDEEFLRKNGFSKDNKMSNNKSVNDYSNVSNFIYLYTLLIILSIWNLFFRPWYEVGELWWIWIFVGIFSIFQANRIMGKNKR